jgi:hypothetical protein
MKPFKHQVKIPLFKVRGTNNDIYSWLEEYVGIFDWEVDFSSCDDWDVIFTFKDPDMALLFKLVWG